LANNSAGSSGKLASVNVAPSVLKNARGVRVASTDAGSMPSSLRGISSLMIGKVSPVAAGAVSAGIVSAGAVSPVAVSGADGDGVDGSGTVAGGAAPMPAIVVS
jgi:hypothetical protein